MAISNEKKETEDPYVSVKTQFSPIEIHIIIIKLLKYIKKKFVNDLTVVDEGEYWETGNKEHLERKFEFLDAKIKMVSNVLSNTLKKTNGKNSPLELAEKIERILREKLGDQDNK